MSESGVVCRDRNAGQLTTSLPLLCGCSASRECNSSQFEVSAASSDATLVEQKDQEPWRRHVPSAFPINTIYSSDDIESGL